MIGYDEIATVLRDLDTEAEGVSLEAILERQGIDLTGASEIAKQRALRMYMIDHNISIPTGKTTVPVDPVDLVGYSAAWLDGFLTGLRLVGENYESSHRRSGR